ncbi:MAG TPA: hypothetical protein VEG68_06560 [Terriglobales bacterium]|nr:hypothetical protein [Terriglobales bacterium]
MLRALVLGAGARQRWQLLRNYDGDGKTDYAVWRPSTGMWYVIQSSTDKIVSLKWGNYGGITGTFR